MTQHHMEQDLPSVSQVLFHNTNKMKLPMLKVLVGGLVVIMLATGPKVCRLKSS
jgi:hypothetical protein